MQCFPRSYCTPNEVTYVLPGGGAPPISVDAFDTEIVRSCDDADGDGVGEVIFFRTIQWNTLTGLQVSNVTTLPSGAAYTPVSEVPCDVTARDIETIERCYQNATATQFYTQVTLLDTSATPPAAIGVVWQDRSSGAIIAAPVGAVPCIDATPVYTPRVSGLKTTAYTVPTPVSPAVLRSFNLSVRTGTVTLTNGPDAGTVFPAGDWSFGASDGSVVSFVPAFNPSVGAEYMVLWTEG